MRALTRDVILIVGMTGSGKTTLARKVRATYPRIITLDPLHEYDGVIVTDIDSFTREIERYSEAWNKTEFNITCRIHDDEEIERFFRIAYELHDYLLTIEETETYVDPQKKNTAFMKLVRHGRHKEISMLLVGQAMPDFKKGFRRQMTSTCTFKQTEPDDLDLLEKYGFDPEEVRRLPPHEYLLVGKPL